MPTAPIPEDAREAAQTPVTAAIRYAGQRAKAGQLNHESVAAELRGNPMQGIKLQALELCVKVMSADVAQVKAYIAANCD